MAGKTVDNSWEYVFMEDVKGSIDNSQHNLPDKIQELIKARLQQWKEVEISFAVTGNSGVGKSSFINAIRGLEDEAEGAAETGVDETTMEPASYLHPTNSKIIFWDLPGIGRIWLIASASAAGAVVPFPGFSLAIDTAMIMGEMALYKTQLGLPQEDSSEFLSTTPQIREKIEKFCFSNPLQLVKFLAATSATEITVEEYSRFIPIIGAVIAGGISFYTTYTFLHECLNELEEAAMEFLEQTVDKTMNDFDFETSAD